MSCRVKSLKLTEDEFLRQVIELAHLGGWRVAHFRPAKTAKGWRTAVQGDGKGFPDLVLVRKRRLIFAELKSVEGKLSPDQFLWLADLRFSQAEVYEWRPTDWSSIEEVLA